MKTQIPFPLPARSADIHRNDFCSGAGVICAVCVFVASLLLAWFRFGEITAIHLVVGILVAFLSGNAVDWVLGAKKNVPSENNPD